MYKDAAYFELFPINAAPGGTTLPPLTPQDLPFEQAKAVFAPVPASDRDDRILRSQCLNLSANTSGGIMNPTELLAKAKLIYDEVKEWVNL